jgi:Na+-driven multidrug efflux pump
MGVQGAAIATGISQTLYALILLCFFLNKKMDEEYQTRTPRFIPDLFKRCIKLGSTFAFSYTLELAGISLFYLLMSKISTDHMTIAGICQTVLIFLSFCGESLMKALIAITGNLIGAKKWDTIRTALYTSIKTYLVFCGLIAFPLLIYPHIVTDIFLTAQHWANDLALSADSNIDLTQLKDLVALSIRYVFIYLVFKGLAWQVSAVLIASGDTRFLALVNPILLWFCFIGPVYICVYLPKLGPEQGWMISAYYSVILLICYLARYYQGKWKKGNLVESFSPEA